MTLKVAVPNKGQLGEPARAMLREAGYLRSAGQRELMVHDPDNEVDFFFLRPKDIATYVGQGILDLGITGRDMLVDSKAPVTEVIELGFGHSTFRLAGPAGMTSVAGRRIATSYPGLLDDWLERTGTTATVVKLDGAVENAVGLGVADAVADVVDTGNTLRQAGLEVLGDPLLRSQALLIRPSHTELNGAEGTFIRRLQGVIVARAYVMVDYDISEDLLEAASAITPGLESPTVSPLKEAGWVAVRAMVERSRVHQVMDELFELGGRAILVTDIHACRL
ncbi:MAG: ATP phosphoribosyltransferase [Candidatus Nanopelagicales bacterium]|nr:ATP phosphoribosyltransferase [Candidatus Nanopelagicales bacterium]